MLRLLLCMRVLSLLLFLLSIPRCVVAILLVYVNRELVCLLRMELASFYRRMEKYGLEEQL